MVRRYVAFVAGVAMVLAFAPAAFAQTSGAQLSGAVTDESGGVLPGAEVTVTQTSTGMTRFSITGSKGEYVFTTLPVGPYKIAAKMSGFNTFEQTGIVLSVGDTRGVNIVMKIGAMTETISVNADAAMVETRSLSVGTVVDHEQLVSLPLNGRSATQLILLSGAAVESNLTGLLGTNLGTVSIAVAGGTGNSTMYLVDGGYNNDAMNNSGNPIPFPDALQEFRAETGVRDARYGMSTGATVNAVTKSGTNQFHGNVFEFNRDHQFNAIGYFERKVNGGLGRDDGLRRNQFGGTFGGPVMKDKLFFFAGYQGTKEHIVPLNTSTTVPTAEVRNGDFRRVMTPACQNRTTNLTLGAPFVDNQIPASMINPISMKIMNMLPLPDPANDPDGCGRIVFQLANDSTEHQLVTRADYQMTANKRIFVRDFYYSKFHPAAFDQNKPNLLQANGNGRGNGGMEQSVSIGLDHVVTQHLFASTRFAYQHTYAARYQGAGVPTWATLGVKTWAYSTGKIPGQEFLGGSPWSTAITGVFYADTPSLSQDFNWTRGAHNFSFGGSWARPHQDGDGPFQANGSMGFSGIFTSGTTSSNGGLNWADFVLGLPATYRGGGSQLNNAWVQSVGLYASDVWRLNRRLTLNYGLRWEPFTSAKDANGFNTAFSRENFEKGLRSQVYTNAPVGLVFAGDAGFPKNGGNTWDKMLQLAPRFGFIWDPTGSGQQTIRAAVGLYFDSPKLWQTAHHMLNPPFGNTVNALAPGSTGALLATCPGKPNKNGCPLDFADPWDATPGGDPQALFAHQGDPVVLPAKSAAFPVNGVYVSMPTDVSPMRSYQWNVSYQRQFLPRMLVEVTYTGNMLDHMWVAGYQENAAVYIPGDCVAGQYALTVAGPCSNTTTANLQARAILSLLNPAEGKYYALDGVSQAYTNGRGSYHGLKVALTRRLANGWSASANYTRSKCVNQGEPSVDITGDTFPVSQIDPYTNPHPDPKTNEGACNADRPHLFNLSSVVISPGIGPRILKTVTKDWQVGLIVVARSGSPLTPGVTGNLGLIGGVQRAVVVPGIDPNLKPADRTWIPNAAGINTRLQWFNMAAFANNSPGVRGNVQRGQLYGPSFWNTDLAFSRNVNMPNGRRVEIRVEAFNLFDHVNWGNPNVTVGDPNAGMVTSTAGSQRIMQFALKYGF